MIVFKRKGKHLSLGLLVEKGYRHVVTHRHPSKHTGTPGIVGKGESQNPEPSGIRAGL